MAPAPDSRLSEFRDLIEQLGPSAYKHAALCLEREGRFSRYYAPLEHINEDTKLAIVGTTPVYSESFHAFKVAQEMIEFDYPNYGVLSLSLNTYNDRRLTCILDFLGIPPLLGLNEAEDLWVSETLVQKLWLCAYPTFKGRKIFAGAFEEIQSTPFLQRSFEEDFLPRIAVLGDDILYLARTRAALQALDWCTENGFLFKDQVLGALPDEDTMTANALGLYFGTSLPKYICTPSDDSRAVINGLRMRTSIEWHWAAWGMNMRPDRKLDLGQPKRAPAPEVAVSPHDEGQGLFFVVNKGEHFAKVLRPHVADNKHTVWDPKRDEGHVLLDIAAPLEPWLAAGYSLRMSAKKKAPSFISPASVLGRKRPHKAQCPERYAD